MDDKKIAFIICANNEDELQECQYYLNHLTVPDGYSAEVIAVWDAKSMTSGYQEAMNSSDAKYKVYLHQDVFILNRNFIADILSFFTGNPRIGMIGCIGCQKLEAGKLPIGSWDVGKVFHNLIPPYMNLDFQGEYREVEMADGLLLATQTDVPWREDLFTGWDFYDCSQAREMQRVGKKVIIPYQKTPWCYHDNKPSRKRQYYRDYGLFLQEYYEDVEEAMYPHMGEKVLELEEMLAQSKKCLDVLLEAGERESFVKIFQNADNRGYLLLREHRLIADIEKQEKEHSIINRFWNEESRDGIFKKLQILRHIIKRLEYDVEGEEDRAYLLENYSDIAISVVLQEYVWDKEKVANKLSGKSAGVKKDDQGR